MKALLFLVSLFILPSITEARQIQIIHTNDLHSYFTGYSSSVGGYARVMTKIKELRANAEAKGIEVLQVDAGDWGDGTSFFLADQGADSIRALEMLGTEVSTIGNHDHLSGGKVLADQIRKANVKTKFVAANLTTTPEMELDGLLQPYVDLERGNIKIRIIGLMTSSNYFEYAMKPGNISYSVPVGDKEAQKAKSEGRELVIALTHIGLVEDKQLALNSSSIDLIIGGHSHTKLEDVVWQTNQEKKKVPIVQAWAHGLSVGSLLLDVSDEGEVKVVEYKLHEIVAPIENDPAMVAFVEESAKRRNQQFGFNWDEIIGQTETSMTGSRDGYPTWKRTCWGNHVARAMRKAVGAQVGLSISGLGGVYKPAGPVTFGDIVDNFPHIHQPGDQGWEIATVYMQGWKLKPFMKYLTSQGYPVDFSGIGYLTEDTIEVDEKATYRIAFPAEIARAVNGSLTQYRQYLLGLKYTKKYLWPVLTDYVKTNSPIKCD